MAGLALCLCTSNATAADALRWFENARPSPQAHQAVELLTTAASHGLEPQDYDAAALLQAIAVAARDPPAAPATVAQLEKALSVAMERYLTDLHGGRADARRVYRDPAAESPDPFNAAASLDSALALGRLREAVQEAAPQLPLYEHLREALARYRELAAAAAWPQLPPLPGAARGRPGKLEHGQPYAGLEFLAQRLAALGDLDPQAFAAMQAEPQSHYAGPIVDAVTSFQQRHGLTADAVIGASTLAQLQVVPAARVRQIELALERLRWTPLLRAPRMIVINIPEFVLRAYEVDAHRISVRHEMKVIVGKALDTRTPLLVEAMRFVEFSPYWNVPASIARAEILPRLARDPGYFKQQGFEFVAADGRVSAELSSHNLDAVRAGASRLRQRPGPQNALGDIKFVFPNREHIYLHHTPQTRLFERERRDFSHGCIRVEQPVALAKFVLQDMPQWPEERIVQAMRDGRPITLRLAEPLPVLVTYVTALVKGGRLHFFADLYGHDRALDTSLRKVAAQRRQSAR